MSWCPYCQHGKAEHELHSGSRRRRCQASRPRCRACSRERRAAWLAGLSPELRERVERGLPPPGRGFRDSP